MHTWYTLRAHTGRRFIKKHMHVGLHSHEQMHIILRACTCTHIHIHAHTHMHPYTRTHVRANTHKKWQKHRHTQCIHTCRQTIKSLFQGLGFDPLFSIQSASTVITPWAYSNIVSPPKHMMGDTLPARPGAIAAPATLPSRFRATCGAYPWLCCLSFHSVAYWFEIRSLFISPSLDEQRG